MSLEWEYIGKSPLPPGNMKNVDMWRSKMPGGWLIMTLRVVRDIESVSTIFFADPNYEWEIPVATGVGTGSLAPPPATGS